MEGPMKNLFDPAGKVALVTGGTSGLGHAIAEAFLQNGVDVAVCSRHPESPDQWFPQCVPCRPLPANVSPVPHGGMG